MSEQKNSGTRKLNPEIKEVDVGTKELRTIKIYPLSANDQFELSKQIINAITEFSESTDFTQMSNDEALAFVQRLIFDNLSVILEYVVTKEERPTFDELTNNQIFEISDIVFKVNYEGFIKNFKNLFERAMGLIANQ